MQHYDTMDVMDANQDTANIMKVVMQMLQDGTVTTANPPEQVDLTEVFDLAEDYARSHPEDPDAYLNYIMGAKFTDDSQVLVNDIFDEDEWLTVMTGSAIYDYVYTHKRRKANDAMWDQCRRMFAGDREDFDRLFNINDHFRGVMFNALPPIVLVIVKLLLVYPLLSAADNLSESVEQRFTLIPNFPATQSNTLAMVAQGGSVSGMIAIMHDAYVLMLLNQDYFLG